MHLGGLERRRRLHSAGERRRAGDRLGIGRGGEDDEESGEHHTDSHGVAPVVGDRYARASVKLSSSLP